MPGLTVYPPFPDDVPTAPLLVIDYALIKAGDNNEKDRLWKAATELGFWYLKNHGADEEANGMFDMGIETLNLPLDEKMKYEQGDDGGSFGYKAAGKNAVDDKGTRDTTEFISISKDDILAWPAVVHRTYPESVYAYVESVIRPFTRKAIEVNFTLFNVFDEKLGLPEGSLAGLHTPEAQSGDISKFIKVMPQPQVSEARMYLSAHTDFGSLTLLHNRLGGLQVLMPGSDSWLYVKPLPGHAVCNIGDTLAIFSAGILRSNIHRVIPPPKDQCQFERHSLGYFTRPNDAVVLRPLEGSQVIAEAVSKTPEKNWYTGATSQEWVSRRVKARRVKHFKGAEYWKTAIGGTESHPALARETA
ncbi:Clavaminate synthase-like protein [Obba rivulosa]|uniref:Clavaminate synthase-like protein n=1 Tax=Obba rivulosa TaxID=1052685 RepID=A0A8E2DQ39_9APHY|nr:Clavaminate synthase-like protein [Obba rivulosa]